MIAKKAHIDYISSGLRNLFRTCNHALNDSSTTIFLNGWVAVAIQNLAIGKATGIFSLNVSNRPITKYILSMYSLWFSAVKTFSTVITTAISVVSVIAVFKYFQSFNLKIRGTSL
jgi:hypothetical protein